MTEAMQFLQNYDITFLRPQTISGGIFIYHLYQMYSGCHTMV